MPAPGEDDGLSDNDRAVLSKPLDLSTDDLSDQDRRVLSKPLDLSDADTTDHGLPGKGGDLLNITKLDTSDIPDPYKAHAPQDTTLLGNIPGVDTALDAVDAIAHPVGWVGDKLSPPFVEKVQSAVVMFVPATQKSL